MIMKNKNNRKCIVKRISFPKENLIRVVKTKENTFFVDSVVQGRGVYVSKVLNREEIDKIKKQRLLNKSFRFNVPQEIYEELLKKIKEK